MKRGCGALLLAILAAVSGIIGCKDPIVNSPGTETKKGKIHLSLKDDEARAVFPDKINNFTYTVTFTDTTGAERPVSASFSVSHTQTLKVGFWNVVVEAKSGTTVVGRDSKSNIQVKEARTTAVELNIKPVTGGGIPDGTLTWSIKYPASLADDAVVEYGSVSLNPLNPGDIAAYGINAGVAGTRGAVASLPPGSYTFRALLKNTASGKLAGNIDTVHIYSGLNSTLNWEFAEESFKYAKTYRGSIELHNPGEVSIANAVLKSTDGHMLSDAPLSYSHGKTWDFEITVFEETVSLNNLYLEILTAANGSEALSHNFGAVSLPGNITLPPLYMYALQAAVGANGRISINGSAPADSMQRDFLHGNMVVLTAVPNSGYGLDEFTGLPPGAVVSGNTATFYITANTVAGAAFRQIAGQTALIHHWPLADDTDVAGGKNLYRPDQDWVKYGPDAVWERNVLWIGEWGAATPCWVENFNQSGRMAGLTASFWIKPDDLGSASAGRKLQNFLTLGTGNAGLYNLSYFWRQNRTWQRSASQ
ncbi:MAG: hypothetical protein LBG95_05430 [Treponema sp.]|jgi:hypothetical protein|nr:hypothetical protein [Treponema sp.]